MSQLPSSQIIVSNPPWLLLVTEKLRSQRCEKRFFALAVKEGDYSDEFKHEYDEIIFHLWEPFELAQGRVAEWHGN